MPEPTDDLFGIQMLPSSPEYRAAGGLDMSTMLRQMQQQQQQDESVRQQESQFAEIMNARQAYDAQAAQQAAYQKAYENFVDWPTFQKDTVGTEPGRQYDSYLQALEWQLGLMGYTPEQAQVEVEAFKKAVPRPPEDRGIIGNLFQAGTSGFESGIRATRAALAGTTDPALLAQLAADQAGAELSAPQARFQEALGDFKNLPEDTIAKYTEVAKRYYDAGVKEPQGFINFIVQQVAQSAAPVMGMSAAGGVAGTMAGGPIGTVIGVAGGASAGSLALDAGSTMLDVLLDTAKARGIDPRDQQALLMLLQDPEVKNKVITDGFKHGIPVAIMDGAISAISFGIGGSVARSVRAGAKGAATAKGVGGLAIDPILSATGERLGQVAQGVDNPQDVFAEALLGPATGVPHMVAGATVGAMRGLRRPTAVPSPTVAPSMAETDLSSLGGGAALLTDDEALNRFEGEGGGLPPIRPGETFEQAAERQQREQEAALRQMEGEGGVPRPGALPPYTVTEQPGETIDITAPPGAAPLGETPDEMLRRMLAETERQIEEAARVMGLRPVPTYPVKELPITAFPAAPTPPTYGVQNVPSIDITAPISLQNATAETLADHLRERGIETDTNKELRNAVVAVTSASEKDKLFAISDVVDGLMRSTNPKAQPLALELVSLAQELTPVIPNLNWAQVAAEAARQGAPLQQMVQTFAEEIARAQALATPQVATTPPGFIGPALPTRRGLRREQLPSAANLGTLAAQLAGREPRSIRTYAAQGARGPGGGVRAGEPAQGPVARGSAGGLGAGESTGTGAAGQPLTYAGGGAVPRFVKGWRSLLREEIEGITPGEEDGDNLRSDVPWSMRRRGAANDPEAQASVAKMESLFERYQKQTAELRKQYDRVNASFLMVERAVDMNWDLQKNPLEFRSGRGIVQVNTRATAIKLLNSLRYIKESLGEQLNQAAEAYMEQRNRLFPEGEGGDNLRSAIRATPGVDMTRMAKLLGPQLYGNMNDIGSVTIKELFQNSFDALKGAIALNQRKDGEIAVDLDKNARTITLTDNGTGMTPETINNAFLTLAGTMKETERASGGLGIAKMLFLFGNESLTLRTVRNGVESTLRTSGAQLMQTFSDPSKAPNIQTRKTSDPSGTTVTVKLPDTFYNEETEKDEPIEFPGSWDTRRMLEDSPLFENVTVTLDGRELAIGKNFPADEYTVLTVAKFPWGKVRILVAPTEYPGYENVAMLSNGLLQFKGRINKDAADVWSGAAPYKFFFNIEPDVKADAPNYPIALNRKGFSRSATNDFETLMKYLAVMYANTATEAESQSFGVLTQFSNDGKIQKQIDLAVPAAKPGTTLKIDKNDKVELRDGRMYVNNRAMPEMTKEQLKALQHDPTQFRVDQALLDPDLLIVHDNVLLNDKPYLEQARAALGDEAVNGYLLGFARTLQRLRDAAAKLGGEKYKNIREVPVGTSIDTEYYGVNTAIPFSAMMLNPTVFRDATLSEVPKIAVGTMIHELTHHAERNHSPTGFIPELQRMFILMAQSGNMATAIMDIERVVRKYPQVYQYFAKEAQSGNLKNRGIRLAGGEEPIGGRGTADRTVVTSETGRNGGDSTNLRQGTGAGNRGSAASQGRAGPSAANAGVKTPQQQAQTQAQAQRGAKLPTTAIAGHNNGNRTHVAYRNNSYDPNSLYTLYSVTPDQPRGVKKAGIKDLTRARVEELIQRAGSEVLPPLQDALPPEGAPRNSSTQSFGFSPDGKLKVAAYEQKDGTWTYYESEDDLNTDPYAKKYTNLSRDQAQRYIAAQNVQPTAPTPNAVRPNGTAPTPIQYRPPKAWEVTWANFKQAFNNIGEAQQALGEDAALRVGLASDLVNSKIQKKKREVNQQFIEPVAKAGEQISKDFNKTQEDIEQVLVHLHLIERSEHKIRQFYQGNLTGQELQDKIQQQEDHRKKGEDFITEETRQNPNFVNAVKRDLAPKMRAMGSNTLDMAAEYGFLTRQAVEAMKRAYDFYVPLITETARTPVGKAATGKAEAGDLSFARMQQQAYGTIIRGETNRPVELLGRLVEAGRLVDKDGMPVASVGPDPRIYFDPETNSLNAGIDSHIFDKNAVPYWREGVRHLLRTDDDAIIQAANKYQGPERETAITKMLGIAGFITHTMSLGKTALSPAFSFFNLPRDIFMATANIDPRIARVKFGKHLGDPRTVLSAFYNSFRDAFGKELTGMYGEARDAGAFVDHRAMQGLDVIAHSVEAAFRPTTRQKLQKKGQSAYKILVAFAQAMESTTRYAMYKAALDSGLSKDEAAAAAKNASINFERRGLAHKYVSPLYMFGNAKLQGLHAMVKLWERSSGTQVAMFAGMLATLGVMAAALGMKYSEKDKDGKSKYSKIPDYRKDSMIVFGEDSSIPGIPLPQEMSPLYVIPNALMEYTLGGKTLGETSSRIFTNFVNSVVPINVPQSEVFGHKARPVEFAMRALTPSPLQPGMDYMTNRNTFGSPVVANQEEKRARGQPNYAMGSAQEQALAVNRSKTLQAYGLPEGAANTIVDPARSLYKATGGFVDVAPQQIRMINNYLNPTAEAIGFWRDLLGLREPSYEGDIVNPLERRFTGKATVFYDQDQFDELLAKARRAAFLAKEPDGFAKLSPEEQALAKSAAMLNRVESDAKALFPAGKMMSKEQLQLRQDRKHELILDGIRRYNELHDRMVTK